MKPITAEALTRPMTLVDRIEYVFMVGTDAQRQEATTLALKLLGERAPYADR